jgi:hypothetical protein
VEVERYKDFMADSKSKGMKGKGNTQEQQNRILRLPARKGGSGKCGQRHKASSVYKDKPKTPTRIPICEEVFQ